MLPFVQIAHGLTRHTSSLEYQYQSGGLNEAFSDVVGAVVEFLVNDSLDTPDFDVGESLGNRLRSMEFPEQGTTAISSVCDYSNRLSVHSTSGPLNKAFVNSVRACEANGCSDERECTILLGTIYMYANVQSLTSYSGYLDAARAICSIVDEYFAAKAPKTKCTADQVTGFIKQGWASVNVALDDTCQSRNCCSGGCPTFDSTKESSGPTPLFSSKPTASPTTLRPTLTPHIPVLTQPPVSSEPDDTATSSDSIILRVANLLRGIFNVWSTFFG